MLKSIYTDVPPGKKKKKEKKYSEVGNGHWLLQIGERIRRRLINASSLRIELVGICRQCGCRNLYCGTNSRSRISFLFLSFQRDADQPRNLTQKRIFFSSKGDFYTSKSIKETHL